jgi:DNA repair protein RadA/Sms
MVETVETVSSPSTSRATPSALGAAAARSINAIALADWPRIQAPIGEFHRVLGGGIVPGSLVLIGGDPGIGKSTLLLQVCGMLAATGDRVLYVAAEESAQQVKLRAERFGLNADSLFVLAETNLDSIIASIRELGPRVVVVDSIQTVYSDVLSSSPGSVSQVRDCTLQLMQLAKQTHVPIFLVGHVTKEGTIAGPRVLEHIVDAVLYLEGDRFSSYRLLRAVKNRFGSTDEVGIFEMSDAGLTEVEDGAAIFLGEQHPLAPGTVITAPLEGTRPLLVEVQGLATATTFGLPRRTTNGIDVNRLHMLLAVLTKRAGVPLGGQDVYVNIVGGLRVSEPAADLAVALAVASSYRDQPVPRDLVALGEIGLSGELRPVRQLERRTSEAARLGFARCVVPKTWRRSGRRSASPSPSTIEIVEADSVEAALELVLGPAPRRRSASGGRGTQGRVTADPFDSLDFDEDERTEEVIERSAGR